jgi:hypothetical protein
MSTFSPITTQHSFELESYWDSMRNETDSPTLTEQDLYCQEPKRISPSDIMLYTIDKCCDNDSQSTDTTTHECPICYETIGVDQRIVTNCNHVFCGDCMSAHLNTCQSEFTDPCCPMCRTTYELFEIPNVKTFEVIREQILRFKEEDMKYRIDPPFGFRDDEDYYAHDDYDDYDNGPMNEDELQVEPDVQIEPDADVDTNTNANVRTEYPVNVTFRSNQFQQVFTRRVWMNPPITIDNMNQEE